MTDGDRILVAGIGNIFFSDDGFGVAVAERLLAAPVPPGVKVEDYGIRGVHLAFDLLDGYDLLVLVDALPMGDAPGTVALFEPEIPEHPQEQEGADEMAPAVDAHTMNPAVVLATLAGLGGSVGRVLVVGCQPSTVAEGMGLSAVVADAIAPAVALVGEVLDEAFATATTGEEGIR